MGKRSDFERKPRDSYFTPPAAVQPLLPFLLPVERFYEPCAGDGRLRDVLLASGHICIGASDIEPAGPGIEQRDAFQVQGTSATSYITNPPWDRKLLHPLIDHLSAQAPTWLLLDADWIHTRQAAPYWPRCSLVVSIGRVKWIENSPHTGKDNCCWYRFDRNHASGPRFVGRERIVREAA